MHYIANAKLVPQIVSQVEWKSSHNLLHLPGECSEVHSPALLVRVFCCHVSNLFSLTNCHFPWAHIWPPFPSLLCTNWCGHVTDSTNGLWIGSKLHLGVLVFMISAFLLSSCFCCNEQERLFMAYHPFLLGRLSAPQKWGHCELSFIRMTTWNLPL